MQDQKVIRHDSNCSRTFREKNFVGPFKTLEVLFGIHREIHRFARRALGLTKVSKIGLTGSDRVTAQHERQQHTADQIPVTVSRIPRVANIEAIAMYTGI